MLLTQDFLLRVENIRCMIVEFSLMHSFICAPNENLFIFPVRRIDADANRTFNIDVIAFYLEWFIECFYNSLRYSCCLFFALCLRQQ